MALKNPFSLDVEDLTSAGAMGLLSALKRFDPPRYPYLECTMVSSRHRAHWRFLIRPGCSVSSRDGLGAGNAIVC